MNETIGNRIGQLRRKKGMSQETLAEKLGVSAQAVSKWENDQSCPDIQLLPQLARVLDTTVDELLTGKSDAVRVVPVEQRKSLAELTLRVRIISADGDKIKVNLPMTMAKIALEMGVEIAPSYSEHAAPLKQLDLEKLVNMVEQGALGKLIEIESAEGDTIEVVVE